MEFEFDVSRAGRKIKYNATTSSTVLLHFSPTLSNQFLFFLPHFTAPLNRQSLLETVSSTESLHHWQSLLLTLIGSLSLSPFHSACQRATATSQSNKTHIYLRKRTTTKLLTKAALEELAKSCSFAQITRSRNNNSNWSLCLLGSI